MHLYTFLNKDIMLKIQLLCIIIIQVILYSNLVFSRRLVAYRDEESSSRAPWSIKYTYPKENAPFQSKVIKGMQEKISSLETSVEQAGNVMKTIQAQNKNLETSLNEQQVMLERMESKFSSIENLLSAHGDLLKELKQTAYPDEEVFAMSNETCGGVLHAQSGYAIYTSKNQQLYRNLSSVWTAASCVWTVQSNYRPIIKLTSHLLNIPYSTSNKSESGAYAIEGMAEIGTLVFKPTKVTKLMKSVTYSFKGPLLYIVLIVPDNTRVSSLNTLNFEFQYESHGRRVQQDTLFSHKNMIVNLSHGSKNFNEDNFDTLMMADDYNITTAFTSTVVSNFTTKLRLRTEWEKELCANNTFLAVLPITAVLFNTSGSQITNLCANHEQLGRNLLTTYGQPLLVIVRRPVEKAFPMNLSWVAETEYPSSVRQNTYPTSINCGSVVGGSSGYISYKETGFYRNGERCVWVIVPQPAPTSSIDITLYQRQTGSYNSKEATNYDHIYIMEFTTIDGEERPDGPKITRLNAVTNKAYTAQSREVYVVFYSDSSVTSSGFSINWKVSGDVVETGNDISTKFNFHYTSSYKNTLHLVPGNSDFFNVLYQVFIFTPPLPPYSYNYVFGMNLELNQTMPVMEATGESNQTCAQKDFYILAVDGNGILQKRNIECYSPGKATIQSANGMVIVIAKSYTTDTGNRNNVTFSFSWKQDFSEDDRNVVQMSNNKCGGVIIGDRGFLKYKMEQLYNKNEHCLWLLQTANGTSITLKLLKDGFGETDRLIANTIDDNGTLRNDDVQLRSSSSSELYTINESLVLISFRPSPSNTNSTGFFLQFWSSNSSMDDNQGQGNVEYIDYRLRHSELHSGRFLYDWNNQSSHAPGKQLHIIAFSSSSMANAAIKSTNTSVRWTLGVFKKNNESCIYDSIAFYTTLLASNATGELQANSVQQWKQNIVLPEENDTRSCSNQIRVGNQSTALFSTEYSAFLVIYKLVPYPVDEDSGGDVRKIDFTHSQTKTRVSETEVDNDEASFRTTNPFYGSYASTYRDYLLRRRLGHIFHSGLSSYRQRITGIKTPHRETQHN